MNAQSQSSDDTSVLDRIINWDKSLSRRLALCSSADSPCGYLRPYMRLLEYSCHGVLWFVGVAAMLLMTHQFEMQQKLLNLFSSEYDILNRELRTQVFDTSKSCLLYTSDAADE